MTFILAAILCALSFVLGSRLASRRWVDVARENGVYGYSLGKLDGIRAVLDDPQEGTIEAEARDAIEADAVRRAGIAAADEVFDRMFDGVREIH